MNNSPACSPLIDVDTLSASPQRYRVIEAGMRKAASECSEHNAHQAFFDEHIPNSVLADLWRDFSATDSPWPYQRPGANAFAVAVRALGVGQHDAVVIYDRGDGIWAARLWWLFRAYGHVQVQVLDGGLRAWKAAHLALEQGAVHPRSGDFVASAEEEELFVDRHQVLEVVQGARKAQLLNVLRRPVFTGEEQRYARAGHIPGSLHLAYGELLDPATGRLLPAESLRELFSLLDAHQPIIVYCGSGITAAGTALALALIGRNDVHIYDGSLSEWSADPQLALVTSNDGVTGDFSLE